MPDGAAALEAIGRKLPDLILADIMMPKIDGLGLLRAVRSDSLTRDIPVMLLSARAGEEARISGLEAGADEYMVKPFSAEELITRVRSLLKLAHIRLESNAMLKESDRRFRALISASSEVIYTMSSDWSEMHRLVGREFLADTMENNRTWLSRYILPEDQKQVMA